MLFRSNLYVMFAVGRWIGVKCASSGLLVSIGTGIAARLVATALDSAIIGKEDFKSFFGVEKFSAAHALQTAFGLAVLTGFCLLGYWVGKKKRLSAYLQHMLKAVPAVSRTAILELAYEEAYKRAMPKASAAAASG